MQQRVPAGAFPALVVIFFFWGFVAASNDILIPVFKQALRRRVAANLNKRRKSELAIMISDYVNY